MTPARLRSAAAEIGKASARLRSLPLGHRAEASALQARLDAIGRTLAREYGRRHGWRVSVLPFPLEALAGTPCPRPDPLGRRGLPPHAIADHPVFYRDAERRPAAIVSFNYGGSGAARLAAAELGLLCEVETDFPNWYGFGTTFVVFRRKPEAAAL
jgi:hypothetical protein